MNNCTFDAATGAPLAHEIGVQAVREGDPGDRRARLIAGGQHIRLELGTVPTARSRSGVHRCPPRNRWTPCSRSYRLQARWGGKTLTYNSSRRLMQSSTSLYVGRDLGSRLSLCAMGLSAKSSHVLVMSRRRFRSVST